MLLFSSFCGCAAAVIAKSAVIAKTKANPANGKRRSMAGRYAKSLLFLNIKAPYAERRFECGRLPYGCGEYHRYRRKRTGTKTRPSLLGRLECDGTEVFKDRLNPLAAVPKVGPQVTLLLEPAEKIFHIEFFRLQSGPQFFDCDWRRYGGFRKCANRIGRGEGSSQRVLRYVDQYAAGPSLRHNALMCHKLRMFSGDQLREDFSKHAQLLERVNAFNRQINMESSRTGRFHKYLQPDLRKFFMQRAG